MLINGEQNTLKNLGYFSFSSYAILAIGLGRAKARPEIWPAGHCFWVARPDPGHIFEGP